MASKYGGVNLGRKSWSVLRASKQAQFCTKPDPDPKLELLQAEFEVIKGIDAHLPSEVSDKDWAIMAGLASREERLKYLRRLHRRELAIADDARRLANFHQNRLEGILEKEGAIAECAEHIYYGLSTEAHKGSSIFLRINHASMNRFHQYRLAQSMIFGPRIVIDMGFYNQQSAIQQAAIKYQIKGLYGANKTSKCPFHLRFTGMSTPNWAQVAASSFPDYPTHLYLFDHSPQDVVDLYPAPDLVYLSPYSGQDLDCVDHDRVYILGGLQDTKSTNSCVAKAKAHGIDTARLPINRYVKQWPVSRSKSISLGECAQVLAHVSWSGGDWTQAFHQNLTALHTYKLD